MKTVRCENCGCETPIVSGQPVICLSCKTEFGYPQPAPLFQSAVEFCPRCGSPLEIAADPGRLCETCGWFGDWQEVLSTPPPQENFDLVLAVLQSLELFRDVCRKEQLVEVYYDAGKISEHDLRHVHKRVQESRQALVTLFTALR